MSFVETLAQCKKRLEEALKEEDDVELDIFILVERKKIDRETISGSSGIGYIGRTSHRRVSEKRTFRFGVDLEADEIKNLVTGEK